MPVDLGLTVGAMERAEEIPVPSDIPNNIEHHPLGIFHWSILVLFSDAAHVPTKIDSRFRKLLLPCFGQFPGLIKTKFAWI
jgi:hypothetical protein